MKSLARALFVVALAALTAPGLLLAQTEQQEREGIDGPTLQVPGSPNGTIKTHTIAQGQILLIPESSNDRIMAFDPATGDLLDADYIPADSTNLSTPICAILSASCDSILVSDQLKDVVQEYDLFGNYLGVFAPAGGPNTAILDNIRGIALRPNGNLLVTVGSGANASSVAEFDTSGNYIGNYVAIGADGLNSPFDVYLRSADSLVGGISSDVIHSYDFAGNPNPQFSPINTFPEQITDIANGNVLVANFSGTEEGIVEYDSTGTQIAIYDNASLGGYRGVWELANGNLLVTNGSGVHEMDRANNLVRTVISGVSARFIELVDLDFAASYGNGCAGSGGFVPVLSMRGCPQIGNTVSVDITQGLGGASAAYVGSLASANTPAFGCTLLVQLPFLVSISVPLGGTPGNAGEGEFFLPLTIPNSGGLVGVSPFVQAVVFDAGAPAGIAFSNGLTFTIQ